jgi:c-di-GMP-related signal transduction protein
LTTLPDHTFGCTMVIARELPIRRELRNALLGRAGAERSALSWIEFHEQNNAAASRELASGDGIDSDLLASAYTRALLWYSALNAGA